MIRRFHNTLVADSETDAIAEPLLLSFGHELADRVGHRRTFEACPQTQPPQSRQVGGHCKKKGTRIADATIPQFQGWLDLE
jgi:hypothetical protein